MKRKGYHQRKHKRRIGGKSVKAGRGGVAKIKKATVMAKKRIRKIRINARKQLKKENIKNIAVVGALAGAGYIASRPGTKAKIKELEERAQKQIQTAELIAHNKIMKLESAAKQEIDTVEKKAKQIASKENIGKAALVAATVGAGVYSVRNRKKLKRKGFRTYTQVKRGAKKTYVSTGQSIHNIKTGTLQGGKRTLKRAKTTTKRTHHRIKKYLRL